MLLVLSFDCAITALNSLDYDDSVLLNLQSAFSVSSHHYNYEISCLLRIQWLHVQLWVVRMIVSYLNWPNILFLMRPWCQLKSRDCR